MSEPLYLEEPLDGRVSMTMLRHFNMCPRSGFLYAKYRRAGVQSVPMMRGSVAHDVFARATQAALAVDAELISPEVVQDIAVEVLAEYPLPVEEHDYLREMTFRWGSQWRLRPEETVVAVEQLFVLDVAGWQVRCKVDFAAVDDAVHLYVADYKSGRGAPPYDEVARRRPHALDTDPPELRLSAKSLQLIVYVLAVVFGRPVEASPCVTCGGTGYLTLTVPGTLGEVTSQETCPSRCHRGLVEMPGAQVAKGCQEAICEYVFPGIEDGEGRMLRRTMGLTRLEMSEYMVSLETVLKRLTEAERDGQWPALESDAACSECSCKAECPIPSQLRTLQGKVNSVEDAREALRRRYQMQDSARAMGREIRKFMEAALDGGPVRYDNRVAELVPRESSEVRDRQGMMEALAGGMSVEDAQARFVRVSKGTSFAERDLSADEIEQGGNDGGK